jgi:hypothetical protein
MKITVKTRYKGNGETLTGTMFSLETNVELNRLYICFALKIQRYYDNRSLYNRTNRISYLLV